MSSASPGQRPSLNLALVERSLRGAQANLSAQGAASQGYRDQLDDRVIANMLAGYRYVDAAVAAREDWLATGQSGSVLKLNNLVLYGAAALTKGFTNKAAQANEAHFYKAPPGGFGEFVEQLGMAIKTTPYSLATEAYLRILTPPQLFLEGNHRTGALLMSYLLLWDGLPPFVLSHSNYRQCFSLSARLREYHKSSLSLLLRRHRFRTILSTMIATSSDPAYLRWSTPVTECT